MAAGTILATRDGERPESNCYGSDRPTMPTEFQNRPAPDVRTRERSAMRYAPKRGAHQIRTAFRTSFGRGASFSIMNSTSAMGPSRRSPWTW